MNADELPDKTYSELEAEGLLDEKFKAEEAVREELQDYYEAYEELNTMIVMTERFLEDLATIREVVETMEGLSDDDGRMALDRIG